MVRLVRSRHLLVSSFTLSSSARTVSGQASCSVSAELGTALLLTISRILMDKSGPTLTVRFLSTLATQLSSCPSWWSVGRSDHLQDQEELCIPTRNEESLHEFRSHFRDSPRCLPFLHPRHGQGLEDVPPEDQLVAARHAILPPYLLL